MLPRYRKLLDKARCMLDTPAGDLRDPERAAKYIWQRMTWGKQRRGYTYEAVLQIVKDQAAVPEGEQVGPTITIWIPLEGDAQVIKD